MEKAATTATKTIYTKPGSDPNPDPTKRLDEYAPGATSSPTGYYTVNITTLHLAYNDFGSGLNLILIRYADVLLMYAEAKNELANGRRCMG
jgi:hypothetical protein